VKLDYVWFIRDKFKKIIGFGFMMPSLALANKKNNGKILPFGWLRIMKAIKKFDVVDFYFVAVDPDYQGQGVLSLMMDDVIKMGLRDKVQHAKNGTKLKLNTKIPAQSHDFHPILHKRRRCFTKKIY